MPATISDALVQVGGSINSVMQQEAVRRQQALEAQAQTNTLTLNQSLLALESQKQQAAGQLGLAKAGAEARQFDVNTGLKREEMQQTGVYQQGQLAHLARTDAQAKVTGLEAARHNVAGERTAAVSANAAAAYSGALAAEATQRTATLKRQEQVFNAPVDFMQWQQTFRSSVEATYGPEAAQQLLGQGAHLWEAYYPDLEKYKDPATGKYIMPQGLIDARAKAIMEVIGMRGKKGPVTEEELGKRVDLTYKSLLADKDSTLTEDQKYTLADVTHRYPRQLEQAMALIDQNSKALLEQNKKALLAQKLKGQWTNTPPTLTADEETDLYKRTVIPVKEAEKVRAMRQLRITGGADHGIVPLRAPGATPPPAAGQPVAPQAAAPAASAPAASAPAAATPAAPVMQTRAGDTYTQQTTMTPTLNKRGETVYQPSVIPVGVRTSPQAPVGTPSVAPVATGNPGRYGPLSQVPIAAQESPAAAAPVAQYPPAELQVDAQFNTLLTPAEEQAFEQWKAQVAPQDSGEDYDWRGAFKAGLQPDAESGHWPDSFKKPNHPTFSDQSRYAQFGAPGHWEGETFVPASVPSEGPIRQGYLGNAYQASLRSALATQLRVQAEGATIPDGVHDVLLEGRHYRVLVENHQVVSAGAY